MLKTAIISLFNKYNKGKIVFAHNLSGFDGIFLLKVLTEIEGLKIEPILREGNMINIDIIYNGIKLSLRL